MFGFHKNKQQQQQYDQDNVDASHSYDHAADNNYSNTFDTQNQGRPNYGNSSHVTSGTYDDDHNAADYQPQHDNNYNNNQYGNNSNNSYQGGNYSNQQQGTNNYNQNQNTTNYGNINNRPNNQQGNYNQNQNQNNYGNQHQNQFQNQNQNQNQNQFVNQRPQKPQTNYGNNNNNNNSQQQQQQQHGNNKAPHWTYDERPGHLGPNEWPQHFKTGDRQSPIDISLGGCERPRRGVGDADANEGNSRNSSVSSSPTASQLGVSQQQQQQNYSSQSNSNDADNDYNQLSSKLASSCNIRQRTQLMSADKKIFLGYPRFTPSLKFENSGHGWKVSLPDELARNTLVTGPSLNGKQFRFEQMHAHWGARNDAGGSEHKLDNKQFSAELHFVHWNATDFNSFDEAKSQRGGLLVLAVFVDAISKQCVGSNCSSNKNDDDDDYTTANKLAANYNDENLAPNFNKQLDKIVRQLHHIRRPNSKLEVKVSIDLKKLFPLSRWRYASYEGSLTTPPLSEVVNWIVFAEPIRCSQSQLDEFRLMQADDGVQLVRNVRPCQAHNNRQITLWTRR